MIGPEFHRRSHANQTAPLEAILAETASRAPPENAALPDDRILSEMTRRIFHAGLSWKMIDVKWAAFEAAFHGFDPGARAFMSDDDIDALTVNKEMVRNGAKIRAVQVISRVLSITA